MLTMIGLRAGLGSAWAWVAAGGWKLLVGLTVALTAGLFIYRASADHQKVAGLQGALQASTAQTALVVKARAVDTQAIQTTTEAKARITIKEDAALAVTEKAIAANPTWAEQPIPADVLSSLQ